jgi:hypothetical protein
MAVIDPSADGFPDTVSLTVILRFYSCALLFLNSGGNFQVIPKPLAINNTTSVTRADPLSDPIDTQ